MTAVAVKAQQQAETAEAGSDLYIDWERTNVYKLERGEGEWRGLGNQRGSFITR